MTAPDPLAPLPEIPDATAPAVKSAANGNRKLVFSVALVSFGVWMLAYAAYLDREDMRKAVWGGTVICPEGEAPWPGTIPIQARWLPLVNYPLRQKLFLQLRDSLRRDWFRALNLERTELLIVAEMPVERMRPLLESGRLPQPGRPEVLAGFFAQATQIEADDGHFHVVGRMRRDVAGLATAYLMPANEVWEPLFERTTTRGWLDPEGVTKIRKLTTSETLKRQDNLIIGDGVCRDMVSLLSLVGLIFVASGGAGLHRAAFARMVQRRMGPLGPAIRAFGEHPGIVWWLHVVLYGTFFFAMAAAVALPQINSLMLAYLNHEFSDGNMDYVSRAFDSGNVLTSTVALWVNNYLWHTVALIVLLSFAVPCAGLLPTLVSFALAGVSLAPLWSTMASTAIFHCITISLENEGYIYACAAVVIFWRRIVSAILQLSGAPIVDGMRVVASGTVLSGIMLAIAGLYEATTLIFLR